MQELWDAVRGDEEGIFSMPINCISMHRHARTIDTPNGRIYAIFEIQGVEKCISVYYAPRRGDIYTRSDLRSVYSRPIHLTLPLMTHYLQVARGMHGFPFVCRLCANVFSKDNAAKKIWMGPICGECRFAIQNETEKRARCGPILIYTGLPLDICRFILGLLARL
jgi:hypothetical protein